jgi:predicted esterase
MPGLFGTPEPIAESTSSALRKSGWTILRMLAQPSRFTERVEFTVADSLDTTAQEIARVLTGRAAECAFAAQAACLHVESSRPFLKSKPRIALGFSAGAMTLPTVVAREPDRYHAAILVGAGCHFWLLNSKSNYATMVGALSLSWSGIERTPERESQLADRYLAHAPLDSFHTAAALHNKPVLMIQGQHDLAVPTSLGETLWERLQRPEKWMRPFGHEFLFINLHKDYNAITDWLNSKLPEPVPLPQK